MLVARKHQEIKLGLLAITEKQVLADRHSERLLDLLALFHGVRSLMTDRLVLDADRIQKIISPCFHLAPSLVAVRSADIMCNHCSLMSILLFCFIILFYYSVQSYTITQVLQVFKLAER